jgi:predicted dehydrogenase
MFLGNIMTSDRLNIALIGATGKVAAPSHLNAIAAMSNVNLYAVCDTDADSLGVLSGRLKTKAFTSYEEVLADPEIDAVDLVTPPFLHAEQAIAAARAGKHVYCEKPMTHSLAEANAMIDAHHQAGTTLMIGESYVFHDPIVAARKIIEKGEIGVVLHIRESKGPWLMRTEESRRLDGQSHEANAPWRLDPELSGGGRFPWIMDHAPHFFATARYLASASPGTMATNVVSITAHSQTGATVSERISGTGAPTGQAITNVAWSFENGVDSSWSQVESGGHALTRVGFRVHIHGSNGSLFVFGEGGGTPPGFGQAPAVTLHKHGMSRVVLEDDPSDRVWLSNNNYYDSSHQAALQHWVDSILAGNPVRYSGEEGRLDLAATLATIKSADECRTMTPEEVPLDWTAY